MMTIDVVRFILPCWVSFCWLWLSRRPCSAGASMLHERHPASRPNLQASCREGAGPVARGGFARGGAAPPGLEPECTAKAEGKIKGRGTQPLENPVCTWGRRGTRNAVAACCEDAQCRVGMGEAACFPCRNTTGYDDGAER